MNTTITEIGNSLFNYNPKISVQKNITISNFYYLHKDLKNLQDFNDNCLYICKSSELPESIEHSDIISLLIIVDKPLPSYLNQWDKYNLILIENKNYNIYNILEKLQNFITRDTTLSHFTKRLVEAISKNLPLDKLIEIAYDYLKNPIIVANSSQHICAYCVGDTVLDEPLWQDYINHSYPNNSYWKKLYYDLNFRENLSFSDKPIIVHYDDFMNHRMFISSIKVENFHLSYIYVLEVNKSFDKIDMEILNILNKLLLPLVMIDNRFLISNNSFFDPLFYELINKDDIDNFYIHEFMKTFNMDLKKDIFLIYIENMPSLQNLKYFNEMLKTIFHNDYIYFYDSKIYIFYNSDINLQEEKLNLLLSFAKENNLKVGISHPILDLSQLKNASYQCKKSILIGKTLNPQRYIYNFDDYIMENLIFTFITNNNLNDLLDINFMNFINENEDEFINTLKTYCLYNGDMQKTSNTLHIHYNTLKYRLQKIKDLYCFDVFNANFISKLKLSFLAMNFLENK